VVLRGDVSGFALSTQELGAHLGVLLENDGFELATSSSAARAERELVAVLDTNFDLAVVAACGHARMKHRRCAFSKKQAVLRPQL
jgi:hypothetical protein